MTRREISERIRCVFRRPIYKRSMEHERKDPQPDETDSATLGNRFDDQRPAEAETIKTDAGEATASHRPSDADEIATEPERVDEERADPVACRRAGTPGVADEHTERVTDLR